MEIRYLIYAVIIISFFLLNQGWNLNSNLRQDKKRRTFIGIATFILVVESSFRGYSVGNDTINYYNEFNRVAYYSWNDVFYRFIETIEGSEKDPGFQVIVKCFQLISGEFRIFLLGAAMWFFVPMGIILYRYSKNLYHLLFAYVLFVALFNIVVLSGVRQQLATGFSFCAYIALMNKKYIRSAIIIALGMTVHISSFVFCLLFPLIIFCRSTKKFHLASLCLIPIVIAYGGTIALYMASFSPNDYYLGYGEHEAHMGSINFVLCLTASSLLSYLAIKKTEIISDYNLRLLYATLPLATFFAPLIMQGPSLIRLGQYFTLFFMITIPFSLDKMFGIKNKDVCYGVAVILLLYMSLKSGFNYYFFWDDPQYHIF